MKRDMNRKKKTRLEAAGWKVGAAREFLGLSPGESAYVELKLALGRSLREKRQKRQVTQGQLAERLHSSQSRVARMESGDASVSLDLLIRSLLAMGVKRRELARIVGQAA